MGAVWWWGLTSVSLIRVNEIPGVGGTTAATITMNVIQDVAAPLDGTITHTALPLADWPHALVDKILGDSLDVSVSAILASDVGSQSAGGVDVSPADAAAYIRDVLLASSGTSSYRIVIPGWTPAGGWPCSVAEPRISHMPGSSEIRVELRVMVGPKFGTTTTDDGEVLAEPVPPGGSQTPTGVGPNGMLVDKAVGIQADQNLVVRASPYPAFARRLAGSTINRIKVFARPIQNRIPRDFVLIFDADNTVANMGMYEITNIGPAELWVVAGFGADFVPASGANKCMLFSRANQPFVSPTNQNIDGTTFANIYNIGRVDAGTKTAVIYSKQPPDLLTDPSIRHSIADAVIMQFTSA